MKNLNREAKYSEALATLVAQDYDISAIVNQHRLREQAAIGQPTEADLRHQLSTPESWQPHFDQHEPTLSPSTLRIGGRFTLTAGQRSTLRDRYEMTPTKVVEVVNIELYPQTKCIHNLVLRSDRHVAESRRKHILVQCCISDFGQWLDSSSERDKEIEKVKDESAPHNKAATRDGCGGKVSSADIVADYLKFI